MATEIVGEWWLPAKPDDRVPGTLRRDDERATLDLQGGFDLYERIPLGPRRGYEIRDWDRVPEIFGISDEGVRYTLRENRVIGSSRTIGARSGNGYSSQRFLAGDGIVGLHLRVEDKVLTQYDLDLEGAREWAGSLTSPVSATFTPRGLAPLDVTLDPAAGRFSILSDEPFSILTATDITIALRALLTLGFEKPVGVGERVLVTRDGDGRPWRNHKLFRPQPPTDGLCLHAGMVDLPTFLPRWLETYDTTRFQCEMLFSTQYHPNQAIQVSLFLTASAAEGIHRELYPDAIVYYEPSVFDDLKQKVLSAFPGKENASKRAFVHDRLKNTPTYDQRLRNLIKQVDLDAAKLILRLAGDPDASEETHIEAWVSALKPFRNAVAHSDFRRPASRIEPELQYYLMWLTFKFLGLVMIASSGASGEVQRKFAGTQRTFMSIGLYREQTRRAGMNLPWE